MYDVLRAIVPDLQDRIVLIRTKPPDPISQPISAVIAKAYVSRLEIQLNDIRRGAEGLKDDYRNHPDLMSEIQELETWVLKRTTHESGVETIAQHKDELGNWLCSVMGYSYSKTKRILDAVGRSKRGAPTKRPQTLRMMDAKLANRWSYPKLASEMCDCGAVKHGEYCQERIRKRIKELEKFLAKYNIAPEKSTP